MARKRGGLRTSVYQDGGGPSMLGYINSRIGRDGAPPSSEHRGRDVPAITVATPWDAVWVLLWDSG
jgi:hypothetical protein